MSTAALRASGYDGDVTLGDAGEFPYDRPPLSKQHLPKFAQVIASAVLERFVGQSPADAARPSLYAATNPAIKPGDFVVPEGRGELRGAPHIAEMPAAATDPVVGKQLWELSEKLTHVTYSFQRQGFPP